MSDTDSAAPAAPEQKEQQLPAAGGSYERRDDGTLNRLEGTEPAPDRAAPEPDQQGTARPAEAATDAGARQE